MGEGSECYMLLACISSRSSNNSLCCITLQNLFVQLMISNFVSKVNVSSGLWYVIKKATFKTEGAVQTSRWILRASCTLSSHTGPCDDGGSFMFCYIVKVLATLMFARKESASFTETEHPDRAKYSTSLFNSFLFNQTHQRLLTQLFSGSPREFPPLCNTPLGLESGLVSDSQITSSSVRGPAFENHNARLNYLSCWSTLELDPWIQVELRAFTRVTKVSTQGRPDADEWVQSYAIKYQVTKISPLLDYESEVSINLQYCLKTI